MNILLHFHAVKKKSLFSLAVMNVNCSIISSFYISSVTNVYERKCCGQSKDDYQTSKEKCSNDEVTSQKALRKKIKLWLVGNS